MLRKTVTAFCIAGLFASLQAAPNARYFALGQACFVGDILVSTAQPWQILGYPDQVQGTAVVDASVQSGPVIMIKSLGENAAIGIAANIQDKRTRGSIFNSNYYGRSVMFAHLPNMDQATFPNIPQINFAFKLFDQKFGLNAFYQTESFNTYNKQNSPNGSFMQSALKGATSDIGGCLSARFGFGNLGWNPWIRIAKPMLSVNNTSSMADSNGVVISNDVATYKLADTGATNLLYNFGSCFDYTFGDWGWGIIGAWYRNEQYRFEQTSSSSPTLSSYSPKFDNDYYDYFASFTQRMFGDLLIGFEYQGAFYTQKTMYAPKNDTTAKTWYNQLIVSMEKPVKINSTWLEKITPRLSMGLNIGRSMQRTEIALAGSPNLIDVRKEWTPVTTKNYDGRDGFLLYMGFGATIKKCTIDFATDATQWYKNGGILMLPPPTQMTVTVDLH